MKKTKASIFQKMFQKIGIDFGSSRVRVCTDLSGVILDQPSCIAVDSSTNQVIAVGDEAATMSGRVDPKIVIKRPVQNGVLQDMTTASALLKILLQPIFRSSFLYGPAVMASVPGSSTDAQKESMSALLYDLGAREVYTIAQPLAASIGAGIPIADASGSFILHLGEGQVESAVISLGAMVGCQSNLYAGSFLRQNIRLTVSNQRSLQISDEMATQLMKRVASARKDVAAEQLITGKELTTGNPKEVRISKDELVPAVNSMVNRAERTIQKLLSRIPAELTMDVIDKGLLLSGGLAQLNGLDSYLIQSLGMPVAVVDKPDLAVINGIETALLHLDEFKESLGYVGVG